MRGFRITDELLDFVFKKGEVREKDFREAFVDSGKYSWNTVLKYKKKLEHEGKLKKKYELVDGRIVPIYYVPESLHWDLTTKKLLYSIGKLRLEFIRWYGTGEQGCEFTVKDVVCEYEDKCKPLPDEIERFKAKIVEEKARNSKEKGYAFDNNPQYKLTKIRPSREYVNKIKDRKHKIYLTFSPTDFYTCMATNLSLDKPLFEDKEKPTTIRDKYIKTYNLSDPSYLQHSPLANSFGVTLATITEDNKIILQKRSQQVALGPGKLTVATAEMMLRDRDVDRNGKPSPFETARRCVKTELGVDVNLEDVNFLMFGVRLDYALPQALGILRLKMRSNELPTLHKAIDQWEGYNFAEEFSVVNLKKYLLEPRKHLISDTAKLSILLALINQYGFDQVERHFKG